MAAVMGRQGVGTLVPRRMVREGPRSSGRLEECRGGLDAGAQGRNLCVDTSPCSGCCGGGGTEESKTQTTRLDAYLCVSESDG